MRSEFEASEALRVDVFLEDKLSCTRSHAKKLIEDGKVSMNGRLVTKAGALTKVGSKIAVEIEAPKEISTAAEDVPFEIVFEDEDIVVVNKPQGLVVHPCSTTKSGTLVNGLLFRVKDLSGINGELRPGIVHRLDKDTSGLMVVAKNDMAHVSLALQIKNKTAQRKYLAVLEGHLKDESGRIENFLKRDPRDRKKFSVQQSGRRAISEFRVLKVFEKCSLVEFTLWTGRTHQIRVHAKSLGHAVVGDALYGHAVKGLEGQLLHAYHLSFTHPRTHEVMTFEVEPPEAFKNFLAKQKEIL